MSVYLAEFLGTMLLIILGDGVVANVVLKKSKGYNSGWIVITTGWGLAVAMAVYLVGRISGAHINPAVTIGLASIGQFPWSKVPGYVFSQISGAFVGAIIVYLTYLPHWKETDDPDAKLAVFCTGPAVRKYGANLLTEIVGTMVLLMGVLGIGANKLADGLNPLLVGFLVWSIGLSLGGPTGYAINPARDFGPRLAHAVLPIPGKRDSDWGYSWIPIIGPIIGGILGASLYNWLF
ncbi:MULTISPECIES: MIP/aquaporin family protein [unclassified Thermotoga]|uniref:MIP/aquaporin family protein n=1 Tax=unclassified Thermotoga TaxID=2631113 RepID=UPI0005A362A8|nr:MULTISPECIES: MIP/aquaporin family protein [unclassified Thermotoga]AJG41155.1 glycerol transporter [Thermotoga sp. RQ7]PLV55704.1 glycerol transporter [Thermotoga sp. SG1]